MTGATEQSKLDKNSTYYVCDSSKSSASDADLGQLAVTKGKRVHKT